MNDKYLTQAQNMAKSSIYDDAVYLGEWNNYRVYEPIFNDDVERCIGFPSFILAKPGEVRWNFDWEESSAIMSALYPPTNEDEDDE